MSTCHALFPEVSLTPSHLKFPCRRTVFKTKAFCFEIHWTTSDIKLHWTTLRISHILDNPPNIKPLDNLREPSLDNPSKRFNGHLSDIVHWITLRINSLRQPSEYPLCSCTHTRFTLCPRAYAMLMPLHKISCYMHMKTTCDIYKTCFTPSIMLIYNKYAYINIIFHTIYMLFKLAITHNIIMIIRSLYNNSKISSRTVVLDTTQTQKLVPLVNSFCTKLFLNQPTTRVHPHDH